MTNNNWQAVTVSTNVEAIEAVADILMTVGADGVAIIDDSFPAKVTAYYEDNSKLPETVKNIQNSVKQLAKFNIDAQPATIDLNGVSQSDWENNWKSYYHTTRITRHFTIVPSWENFVPCQKDEYPIIMDPKLSFGTGIHETTRLMIQALEVVTRGNESMIDVGTGSGVLSVAAKQLGVADILATDIDEMAVSVAKENLALNPIANDVSVVVSDLLAKVSIEQPVDLIVANILADVIERLIPQTWTLLKPNGYFLVSGIYDAIAKPIEQQLKQAGYTIFQHTIMGDWHAFIAKKECD
ncbi:ribosomal protein L11 methyltransferase [Leuconostoc litchii]|uniref:Ribosomal protein L11 methyltransferase n=1 Tax=Leuconostoc litchii TaxID=1981069 RepID=A0A6P2CRH1_9LACO|nr:50S ribosomal protein L11 methyltransferase [Leuconostoc litchii]TYC46917.1 50S ribosomal protein L11 methyltransferase [Leuconostoc litchii]GMA68820.1 ribosomal protein L11 methyltransferase [Leuconostoc litchii]